MSRDRLADDDVALSESVGVLVLVVFTVVITATVAINVLLIADEAPGGPPEANFTYDHISEASVLQIRYDFGDPIDAGNLTVSGPDQRNVTWAELAQVNDTTAVRDNATAPRTVLLSSNSPYGAPVTSRDRIRIVYTPPSGNETVLSEWDGS
jgi:FlaG/FlaF family flagellin (archaellin)